MIGVSGVYRRPVVARLKNEIAPTPTPQHLQPFSVPRTLPSTSSRASVHAVLLAVSRRLCISTERQFRFGSADDLA